MTPKCGNRSRVLSQKKLDFSDVAEQYSTHGHPKMPNWSTKEIGRTACMFAIAYYNYFV